MNDIISKINELEFEKILWLIFIFVAALNIYGDNIQELFLTSNNPNLEQTSKKIFTFTVAISLLIYLYFGYRNYKYVKITSGDSKQLSMIRFAGSILIIIGTIFILYYDIKDQTPVGTPTI